MGGEQRPLGGGGADGIDRRTALKATSGVLAGGVILGTLLHSDEAAASSFSLSASDVDVTTVDGSISEVYLEPTLAVWWEAFDEEVERVRVAIESKIDGETDWQDVLEETITVPGDQRDETGDLEASLGPGDQPVTLYDGADAAYFEATGDGETETTAVTLGAIVELRADGELAEPTSEAALADETTFQVTVENAGAGSGGTVDAGTGAEA